MAAMRILIVTPSLNQGQYIESTIKSVVAQLEEQDCYVVVDADSSDDTQTILATYQDSISHVHVDSKLSQAAALVWAYDRFEADICCYLNSDDLLLPDALKKVRQLFLNHPELEGVYSHRLFIDEESSATGVWALPAHSNYLMRRWDYIPQETCFWRMSAMTRAGGIDSELEFALDYDFFVRLMSAGRVERIDDYLGAFRVHATSKTSTVLATQGKTEIAMIHKRYAIRRYPWDRLVGGVLRRFVEWGSRRAFAVQEAALTRELAATLALSTGPSAQTKDRHPG